MKLQGHSVVKGIIHCETGLRVGGSKDAIEIGTKDTPIIRHPVTDLPYIPGSSIKGKMRSLLELKYDKCAGGKPCSCGICDICKLFGCGDPNNAKEATRLLFRDASITKESEAVLLEAKEDKGVNFSEIKYETRIDRQTNKAADKALHNNERIPSGTNLYFELSIRIFGDDSRDDFKKIIAEGLSLMQSDYLGGSGSRGYGKIKFEKMTFDGQTFTL